MKVCKSASRKDAIKERRGRSMCWISMSETDAQRVVDVEERVTLKSLKGRGVSFKQIGPGLALRAIDEGQRVFEVCGSSDEVRPTSREDIAKATKAMEAWQQSRRREDAGPLPASALATTFG